MFETRKYTKLYRKEVTNNIISSFAYTFRNIEIKETIFKERKQQFTHYTGYTKLKFDGYLGPRTVEYLNNYFRSFITCIVDDICLYKDIIKGTNKNVDRYTLKLFNPYLRWSKRKFKKKVRNKIISININYGDYYIVPSTQDMELVYEYFHKMVDIAKSIQYEDKGKCMITLRSLYNTVQSKIEYNHAVNSLGGVWIDVK